MTPAVTTATKAGIVFDLHEYKHDADHASYGLEAAEKLGVAPEIVFKTLVVTLDADALAVGIVPVLQSLDLKAMARALGARKAQMADVKRVERTTGYVAGGVSPLGQKRPLPTVVDDSAQQLEQMFVSAGRRGLEISLSPNDLSELTAARFAAIAR